MLTMPSWVTYGPPKTPEALISTALQFNDAPEYTPSAIRVRGH